MTPRITAVVGPVLTAGSASNPPAPLTSALSGPAGTPPGAEIVSVAGTTNCRPDGAACTVANALPPPGSPDSVPGVSVMVVGSSSAPAGTRSV